MSSFPFSSPEELQRFDKACSLFEDALKKGQRPSIEKELANWSEPVRIHVFEELRKLELHYHRKSEEGPSAVAPANPASPFETVISKPSSAVSAPLKRPLRIGRYRIEKVLGEGGFGLVYLALDDQLQRLVAIKVPHSHRISTAKDAEAYLTEARTVANLDHPNIVAVHDVGSTEDCPCFIVSKFIEGSTLAQKIKNDRPTFGEAAALIATIAEALHYAHRKGLVHRDIKPSNILLDATGKPFVVDFGLALKEENVGLGPKYAGTPQYMSPEQARGEGHRVDGRSDIFSLGVVFYELLVGRQPFRGDSQTDLMEQIVSFEPRPPRQYDDSIPKELDRICLKALSKRASERYSTAKDMADDLRHFLTQQPSPTATGTGSPSIRPVVQPLSTLGGSSAAVTPTTPTSDHQPVRIVPKGLRSFDAGDADFFLELLPGPRDREGLPDSIRFWKTRIEETDADNTFSVGLIYGPSGCGKSSLMKAGLLPRLSDDVTVVYVEATAEETETRLLNGLRKRCPGLIPVAPVNSPVANAPGSQLKGALAALRRGQGISVGKKVLIVLDQFEQWLHALASRERKRPESEERERPGSEERKRPEFEQADLIQALRQCDGERVQCIVMVRDDFWLAVSRFLRELEVRLVEGQNSALVDLFPLRHAEKVLAAFGRAFGVLPDSAGETSKEQKDFLIQAVAGLAQEGKLICVRLALFAEMMKGKPWTLATLKEVGGTEGVGVTFLEETFSATTAPPEHRYHQKAARAVLKALLPQSGTDIKGSMRSHAELLEASGYANRLKDFDDLIRILDGEIRLITPTDPEGVAGDGWGVEGEDRIREKAIADLTTSSPATRHAPPSTRYYQLTHDYLVHSLRDWLTRKQKETRRGRAELLLADRAALWNARPENRQLPSLRQWFQIRLLTRQKTWLPPQRKMMHKAARFHAARGLVVAVILALFGWGIYEGHATLKAQALTERLLDANTNEVPIIVEDMAAYRRWLDPLLHGAYQDAKAKEEPRKQLHASLALLPTDPSQVDYLYGRLLDAQPQEVSVIRDALLSPKQELIEKLWSVVEQPARGKESQRLRAASALATYDPENPQWENVSGPVVEQLVTENSVYLALWMEAFRPVRIRLLPPLAGIFNERKDERASERTLAANILADYAADQPRVFADLVMDADEKQFAVFVPKLKDHGERGLALAEGEVANLLQGEVAKQLVPDAKDEDKEKLAKRQANGAVALLLMDRTEKVWPLLKHSPDPRARSYLIHRFGPLGADAKAIWRRLDDEPDVTIRRALILCLGEFGEGQIPSSERQVLSARLFAIYKNEPDAGLHGAAEWLLRQWGQGANIKALDDKLRTKEGHLKTALKGTEEQKQRLSQLTTEMESIQSQLSECKETVPVRQEAWERKLREQPPNFPASLHDRLIAHYPLDEKEGTETASAVKDQPPGTYEGKGKPEWVPGVVARALRLDGKGGFDCGTDLQLERTDAMSYGCWFLAQTDSRRGCLVGKFAENRGYALSLDPSKFEVLAEWTHEYPDNTLIVRAKIAEPTGRWHHLFVTYDGTSTAAGVRIYLDGRLAPNIVELDQLSQTFRHTSPLQIGWRHKTWPFRGDIDDVRIYHRRLADQEVALVYDAGIQALVVTAAGDRTREQKLLLANYYRPLDESLRRLAGQLTAAQKSLRESELRVIETNWARRWYVNGQGQTMVVIPGPVEFMMGSPTTEQRRWVSETQHMEQIDRTFALGAKSVTEEQFRSFDKGRRPSADTLAAELPAGYISWYQAAAYCNWLSKEENIPEVQWCYETKNGQVTKLKQNYLTLTGYRLPTEAEMEYATRAGAMTSRYYGETEDLLPKYSWYKKNSKERTWPVGSLKPNDLGLFDMQGNVYTWCQESYKPYPRANEAKANRDQEDGSVVMGGLSRVMRGASSNNEASNVRSAFRISSVPANRNLDFGLRVARTLPP